MYRHLAGRFCALFLPLLLVPALASAGVKHWNTAVDGSLWNVAGNWLPSGVPTATDTAVIDFPGTYSVNMNVNPTIAAMRINGSASGTQTVVSTSRAIALPNATTIGAQGIWQLASCTVTGVGAITNEGTMLVSPATTSIANPFSNASGAMLRIQSTASAAALTIASGFTNNGAIELTNSTGTGAATLTVTTGTLTNAASATISALAGAGGSRLLTAQLNNAGTITIGANTTTSVASADHVNTGTIDVTGGNYTVTLSGTTPSFTMTSGAINVASGRTLSLNGATAPGTNQVYQYNGGTLGGSGSISMTNATLALGTGIATSTTRLTNVDDCTINGPGTLTVSTGTTLNPLFSTTGSTINAPVVVQSGGTLTLTSSDQLGTLDNSGTFNATGACTSSGFITTQPGSVIRVYAGTFTVNNSFTNSAAIELTALSGTATAVLSMPVAATLTNAVSGTISALAGTGGSRQLNVKLNNAGTITVGATLSTSLASADHVNTGTIDVTGANYTVILSGTTPSFTMTSGAINVASGRTLNLNGAAASGEVYQYNGGTLGGLGSISMTNATLALGASIATSTTRLTNLDDCILNGPGTVTVSTGTTLNPSLLTTGSTVNAPVVVQSGGTLTLSSSDQLGTLDNSGTFNATGACTSSGFITTQPGSVIRVYAGTLIVNNSFTNSAALELTSQAINTSAVLSMPTGTLTNAVGGTISVLAGPGGGSRQLNAEYNNAGTLTVGANLITSVGNADHVNSGTIDVTGGNYTLTLSGSTPTFVTTGTINVASGRTLTLNGPSGTTNCVYTYTAGTLGGAGTVSLNDATLVLNTAMNTATTHLDPASCIINGPSVLTVSNGTTLIATSSTLNGPVVVEPNGTFDLNTSSLNGLMTNGGLWLVHGFCPVGSTNITTDPNSVIRIEGNGGTAGWMQVSTGFTNDSAIELTSNLVNGGNARLDLTSGILVNTTYATISSLVGGGGARTFNANVTNVGTINVAATMTSVMTPTNILNTGTINLTTGNWTHTMGGTTGTFTSSGIINIPVGRTLALNGNSLVNRGAGLNYNINPGSNISGGGILSARHSTLKFNIPYSCSFADLAGDSATFAGPDTTYITAGDSVHASGSLFSGPVVVAPGGRMSVNVCDITGAMRNGGLIEVINLCTSSGAFTSLGGSSIQCVAIGAATSRFRFASGMTNHGVIDLTSRAASGTAILETTAGTITNSPTGVINSVVAVGGARQILAPLANAGQLNIQATLTLNEAGAAHTNSGTIDIDATKNMTVVGASLTNTATGTLKGSGTLTLSGGTIVFDQQGKIAPGASPGVLNITRSGLGSVTVPFASTSSFDVEVGGDSPGTGYDQVTFKDPVTLNGALNLSVINGYQPQPGRRYVIATFASRTGTFSSVTGLDYNPGQMWAVAYSDTDVVLLAMDQTWSRAFPDGAPPAARDGHAAAYDPTGDRMMVFGGQTDASVMNDTWVLSKAVGFNYPAWTQLTTAGVVPSQRRDATAVYAAASNRLIVFGGADGAGATFGDVRVLTNANGVGGTPTWSLLSPTGTPPSARSGHAAAYDAANDRMIVMGGDTTPNSCGGELADVWVLSNASGASGTPAWTQLSPTGGPPSVRSHQGASYDAATGRLIVTGGDACGVANTESWTLSNANGLGPTPVWTQLAPAQPAPANWSLGRYAYDDSYGWLDAFGGKVGATLVDTAFTLTNAQGSGGSNWYRRLFYGNRPAPRAFHSMILSSATHTAVVFGGMTATGRTNDVWRRMLDKGPVLAVDPPVFVPMHTAFALPPSPNPARGQVSMAVDIAREQRVDLAVFDLAGRRVETIHSGMLPVGRHTFEWAGARSGRAAPGVYMVRMKAEDKTQILRIVQL